MQAEYDNYIAWLLDHQTSQQHLLREQVEQMALRGTSRPQELAQAVERVDELTEEAQSMLELNQRYGTVSFTQYKFKFLGFPSL